MKTYSPKIDDVKVMAEVFISANSRDPKTFDTICKQIETDLGQWRVIADDERIVGVVHIKRDLLCCGGALMLKGDIGSVAVHKDYQKRGIGSLVLKDAVDWMHKEKYHLSRLGGLSAFYSKFGFKPFCRSYIEFPVPKEIRAGAQRIPYVDTLPGAKSATGKVRTVDYSTDNDAVWDLMEAFSRDRTGERLFERPTEVPPPPGPDALALVYEDKGKVLGILFARECSEDLSPFESKLRIGAICYDPNCPDALAGLLTHVVKLADKKDIRRITAPLPFDKKLFSDIAAANITYIKCELNECTASNMMQVINLNALFESLREELNSRVAELSINKEICFDIGKEKVYLALAGGKLTVSDKAIGSSATVLCRLSEVELIKLLFGSASSGSLGIIKANHMSERSHLLIETLFPEQPLTPKSWK